MPLPLRSSSSLLYSRAVAALLFHSPHPPRGLPLHTHPRAFAETVSIRISSATCAQPFSMTALPEFRQMGHTLEICRWYHIRRMPASFLSVSYQYFGTNVFHLLITGDFLCFFKCICQFAIWRGCKKPVIILNTDSKNVYVIFCLHVR